VHEKAQRKVLVLARSRTFLPPSWTGAPALIEQRAASAPRC
jgi:hypothetical protein